MMTIRLAACALLALTLTATQANPDFSGTWTLDRRISDDPALTNFEAPRQAQGDSNSNRRRGNAGGFGGRGGYGGYGGGSRTNRNTPIASLTPEERARLVALTTELKTASATLTIEHHDPSFGVTDARGTTLLFDTSGAKRDHTLGDAALTSTTHWQDGRIVTEFALGGTRTLVYTYTLLPKTHQLVLRVRPQSADAGGGGGNAPELKLVYVPKP
jgi:hypothetical protein